MCCIWLYDTFLVLTSPILICSWSACSLFWFSEGTLVTLSRAIWMAGSSQIQATCLQTIYFLLRGSLNIIEFVHRKKYHKASHCITKHHMASHYITRLYTASQRITLHQKASRSITRHHTASQGLTQHHKASHCVTRPHTASQGIIQHQKASHCITRPHTASQGITLRHKASHGDARIKGSWNTLGCELQLIHFNGGNNIIIQVMLPSSLRVGDIKYLILIC